MTTREKHSGSSEVILQSTNVTTQSSDLRLRSSSTGGRHLISLLLGLSFLFSQSLNASNSGDLAGAERLPDEAGPAKESRADEKKTGHGGASDDHASESRLSPDPIPLQLEGFPQRPKPILELGAPFLGTGRIGRGFRIPGGAVWQPSFLLFGTFRSAVSSFDNDVTTSTQWANRLDLFGNLYLSGTERLVFGLRPLDETVDDGTRHFSGYRGFSPDPLDRGGWENALNFDWDTVTHLFFEGDFGEIFPNLDQGEKRALDLGFSVGRQPINFQEGLLINDFIDAVGITRNNLKPKGTVNLRMTGLFAWNQINRNTPSAQGEIRNLEGDSSQLYGLFTETDWRWTTMAADFIYVQGGTFRGDGLTIPDVKAGDGIYMGASFIQRLGDMNSSFRVLASLPVGEETPGDNGRAITNPARKGTLFFAELSWTPHHTHNLIYANGFLALGNYRAAALDGTIPGPLARAGLLFAGPGVGNYPGALSPTAGQVVGGDLGYQMFFDHTRRQLIVETGGRISTEDCTAGVPCGPHSFAGGARLQQAFGRRFVVGVDGYASYERSRGDVVPANGDKGRLQIGGRLELLVKF